MKLVERPTLALLLHRPGKVLTVRHRRLFVQFLLRLAALWALLPTATPAQASKKLLDRFVTVGVLPATSASKELYKRVQGGTRVKQVYVEVRRRLVAPKMHRPARGDEQKVELLASLGGEVKSGVGIVIDNFGVVEVASSSTHSLADRTAENNLAWSIVFKKRPLPSGERMAKLFERLPLDLGWGLFFERERGGGFPSVRLDLTKSRGAHEFLTNHKEVAKLLSTELLFSPLLNRIEESKPKSGLFAVPPPSFSSLFGTGAPGPVLSGELAIRGKARLEEINRKFDQVLREISHNPNIEQAAYDDAIILDTGVIGLTVKYVYPSEKTAFLSGFYAKDMKRRYRLRDQRDRVQFATDYPVVFEQLGRLMKDSYDDYRARKGVL